MDNRNGFSQWVDSIVDTVLFGIWMLAFVAAWCQLIWTDEFPTQMWTWSFIFLITAVFASLCWGKLRSPQINPFVNAPEFAKPSASVAIILGLLTLMFCLLTMSLYPVWKDEYSQGLYAYHHLAPWSGSQEHQPSMEYLIQGWILHSTGLYEKALRIPAIAWSTILVPLFFLCARALSSSTPLSLLFTAILCASHHVNNYFTEARPYAFGMLAAVLTIYKIARRAQGNKSHVDIFLIASLLMLMLGLGGQTVFLVLTLGAGTILISMSSPNRKWSVSMFFHIAISFLIALPFLIHTIIYSPPRFKSPIAEWMPQFLSNLTKWQDVMLLNFPYLTLAHLGLFAMWAGLAAFLARPPRSLTKEHLRLGTFAAVGIFSWWAMPLVYWAYFRANITWGVMPKYFILSMVPLLFSLAALANPLFELMDKNLTFTINGLSRISVMIIVTLSTPLLMFNVRQASKYNEPYSKPDVSSAVSYLHGRVIEHQSLTYYFGAKIYYFSHDFDRALQFREQTLPKGLQVRSGAFNVYNVDLKRVANVFVAIVGLFEPHDIPPSMYSDLGHIHLTFFKGVALVEANLKNEDGLRQLGTFLDRHIEASLVRYNLKDAKDSEFYDSALSTAAMLNALVKFNLGEVQLAQNIFNQWKGRMGEGAKDAFGHLHNLEQFLLTKKTQ